jgi:hypothetical protein
MENPSSSILKDFKIKIAVDTQLLAYLIDNTYPSFNFFFKKLVESPFVDIVCSRFVTFEFIGIRKLEHYLRAVYEESKKSGGTMNFSSALKYKNAFSAPELDYIDCYEYIKSIVENELKEINDDYGIEFEDNFLHEEIWKPHQDLVLSSRISKEDSLVLLSSIFPQTMLKENHTIFITNDAQFYGAFKGKTKERMPAIDDVFNDHNLNIPYSYKLDSITLSNGKAINLSRNIKEDEISKFVSKFIFEHIKLKNKEIFLGETLSCECKTQLKKEMLCFELFDKQQINKEVYTVIIYKDELEIKAYTHHSKLTNFYCYGEIKDFPYSAKADKKTRKISVKIKDKDNDFIEVNLMKKITSKGNLVFIHPDADI